MIFVFSVDLKTMIVYLLMIVVFLWMVIDERRKRNLVKLLKLPQTDLQYIPILGHAHYAVGNNEHKMRFLETIGRESIKIGGAMSVWMVHRLFVVVSDPELAELLGKYCLEKDDTLNVLRFFVGNGSIFAPVPIWRPRRKFLAHTLSLKNLNNFVNVFAEQSALMVEQLQTAAGTGPVACWNHLLQYTLTSFCETILGTNPGENSADCNMFLVDLETALAGIGSRLMQPWLWNDALFKLSPLYQKMKLSRERGYTFVKEIVRGKRDAMKKTDQLNGPPSDDSKTTKSFLQLLIEESRERSFSELELQEEILVLMSAGIDTTAVAMGFIISMLAQYPEEQEKVHHEIEGVFGSSDRLVSPDDLPRLKYMEVFLKETLRLYTPVPVTARKVIKDITLPSGVTLVEGCGVLLHNWAINRNPQYWGADAEQFRPSRFLEPMRHPAQFMAFSCGPRNCLGYQFAMMSMKTGIATLLRRYRVLPADATCAQPQLRLKYDLMMKDVDNYTVRLEPKNKSKP